MSPEQARYADTAIHADTALPVIRITRDFRATPAQLLTAHIDPELVARWNGPDELAVEITKWDARDGGEWAMVHTHEGERYAFRGCFHSVSESGIIQTFTYLGEPDQVMLERLSFTDLGDGTTRLEASSLCENFEVRDQWVSSGMEDGVNQGYAALDRLIAAGGI